MFCVISTGAGLVPFNRSALGEFFVLFFRKDWRRLRYYHDVKDKIDGAPPDPVNMGTMFLSLSSFHWRKIASDMNRASFFTGGLRFCQDCKRFCFCWGRKDRQMATHQQTPRNYKLFKKPLPCWVFGLISGRLALSDPITQSARQDRLFFSGCVLCGPCLWVFPSSAQWDITDHLLNTIAYAER